MLRTMPEETLLNPACEPLPHHLAHGKCVTCRNHKSQSDISFEPCLRRNKKCPLADDDVPSGRNVDSLYRAAACSRRGLLFKLCFKTQDGDAFVSVWSSVCVLQAASSWCARFTLSHSLLKRLFSFDFHFP